MGIPQGALVALKLRRFDSAVERCHSSNPAQAQWPLLAVFVRESGLFTFGPVRIFFAQLLKVT